MSNPQHAPNENAEKDPSQWVTGDEPMTGPQRSYLHTLAQEAGRQVPDDLSKAQASELIDELQERTGRGSCAVRELGRDRPSVSGVVPLPPRSGQARKGLLGKRFHQR